MKMNRKRFGFTLPEMVVVISLGAMLVAIVTIGVVRYRDNAENVRIEAELTSIFKAMEAYRQVYGRYPVSYAELGEFVSIPNFNSRYDINPNPGGG